MYTQPIQRPVRQRSSLLPLTCGCLVTLAIISAVAIVAAIIFLPRIGASLLGMTPQGETAAVFADVTPQPTIELIDISAPSQVTFNLGGYGDQTFNNDNPQLYQFQVGTVASGGGGGSAAVATFTEQGLNELCRARTTICGANATDPRIRNARIDLRPGGAIVYADVTLPEVGGIQQTAGVVLKWDSAARRVVVAGVDYGGTLYSVPPQGLGATVSEIEAQANSIIQQLSVGTGGSTYTLAEVQSDETLLTLILR